MNWMNMREFLRGGYKELTGPTVISNHGRPVFTVFPHDGKPVEVPPRNNGTAQERTTVR